MLNEFGWVWRHPFHLRRLYPIHPQDAVNVGARRYSPFFRNNTFTWFYISSVFILDPPLVIENITQINLSSSENHTTPSLV